MENREYGMLRALNSDYVDSPESLEIFFETLHKSVSDILKIIKKIMKKVCQNQPTKKQHNSSKKAFKA